ncbi:hypothetical protein CDAR_501081 [Caerostris darwini]|uniref:RING-type domain-containing protein n=1 Tax=Caerostris darwini TaxID=1538125 RepID=A0AAV4PQD1_9ARAC|nr:hypothetical protein CDAR_501081 [Caerostris darwini]
MNPSFHFQKMGVRKKKTTTIPLRPSLPRRCKEKQRPGSGIFEEKERAMACRICGRTAVVRDPNYSPKHKDLVYVSKKETVELPTDVDIECAICLNTSRYKRMLRLFCNHRFHKKCIMQWFKNDIRCPVCRK